MFPHLELHDLAGDIDREVIDEHDVPGNLVMGDLPLAEVFDVLFSHGLAGFHLHPCAEFLTVLDIRHPDHIDIRDLLVVVQVLLDLTG